MVTYTGALSYQQSGRCFDYTPGAAKDAGELVAQGKLLGVATTDLEAPGLAEHQEGARWQVPAARSPATGEYQWSSVPRSVAPGRYS